MEKTKEFHFIGIGGIGMSGLARILLKKNIAVSGSDISTNYLTEGLVKEGAKVFLGHSAQQLPPHATVVYSTDIKNTNPEYQAAIEKKYPMMHRSDLLLHLMQGYKTLAIAGTHGKTTTSSLLTWVMKHAGQDPSFAVGGIIPQFQSNAGHGEGEYFVAEADESDGTFLKYHSYGAIVTNINSDHIAHYGSMNHLVEAFKEFIHKIEQPAHLFWCGDDPYLQNINSKGISYGFGENCILRISRFMQCDWSIIFDIEFKGKRYSDIQLSLVGRHNSLNGAAVFGMAISLGISEESIREAFKSFGGVLRRCEKKGEIQNVLLLDDYAHHPTEIKTTLQGIRQAIGARRLIVVFQPHRYSRTKDCLGLYHGIFDEADELFITEIYSAGENPIQGLASANIIAEIENESVKKCRYVVRKDLAEVLLNFVTTHDVIVSLGAGDITKLSTELLNHFKLKLPKKLKVGIVFGGRSTEHEVTFLSATHVINCVRTELYEVHHFGITKKGYWISGNDSMERLKRNGNDLETIGPCDPAILNELLNCDVLIPVFHGPYGEDGTIQGFFEILDKAYVGTDHTSAAICMDKALTKRLMNAHNIPTLQFIEMNHSDWKQDREYFLNEIKKKLHFPVFIKPVHLGSTVGIQKVEKADQLASSIELAFQYDYKLIVEQGLVNPREIEFAVLGNEQAEVFPPGEILTEGKIYDYEGKYSANGIKVVPRASLSYEKMCEGMILALSAYRSVHCTGMARVDFFLDSNGKFWLNEINPIPGFTPNSLYPKICEVNGVDGKQLCDHLIIFALERKRRNTVLCRNR